MSKYFSLSELTYSDTAKKHDIDNTPDDESKLHLEQLMDALDEIRENWGGPITVTSGYRCKELNNLVGGVPTSAHTYGYAADLVPTGGDMDAFKSFICSFLKDKDFDQCILESNGKSE